MLILFDLDGTLMRGKGLGRPAVEATIKEIFDLEVDLTNHWFGGKTDWFSLIELLTPHGVSGEDIAAKLPEYQAAKVRHMEELIKTIPMCALPGALETVEALRERPHLPLGVLTGNVESTALFKLRAVGFDPDWFTVRVFGHEAINRNDLPPLALQRATAPLNRIYAPEDVGIIGDTLRDIECAKINGLRVVAVTTGFQDRDELAAAKPDYLIDDLRELLKILP
jgi:phosphoglycolate phosphatase-like HAD superfamily hydrolase